MKSTNYLIHAGIFTSVITLLLIGCNPQTQTSNMQTEPQINKAVCVLTPTEGNNVHGIVNFNKTREGILVEADVTGLTPGKHGFHIHEYGDITSSDGTSTGGHFNPDGQPHGGPTDIARHVGDLGNITADSLGNAHLELTDSLLAFSGKHSIIGRAVIVHQGEDDYVTQPTGNAGARVAEGVIGIAKE